MLHILVSYHPASDYTKNGNSQMSLQAELPVLNLDISENGKQCYEVVYPYNHPLYRFD